MNTKTDLEIRNEEYASKVCQKYGLEYIQGKGVCGSDEITNDLKAAREEIKAKMPVSEMYWLDEPDNCYFFTFNSWEAL